MPRRRMGSRAAKRKKLLNYKSSEVHAEDRISDLPSEIVHHILSFLPDLKHVARTCVLSKQWKHLWYAYPCLTFTDSSPFLRNCRPNLIDHVMRLLEKRSDVRSIRFEGPTSLSGLVRLMRNAVKCNVQELDLEFSAHDNFNLPRCIVNSLSLRHLTLRPKTDLGLSLPPLEVMKNGGFKSLESLWLSRVNLQDQPLLLNLFTFPSLTKLCLESCLGLKCLRIQIPWLRDLSLQSCSEMQELDVAVEKLEKLRIEHCFNSNNSVTTRLKIEAPSLETIIWSDRTVPDECVIGKFDKLNEVVVSSFFQHKNLSALKLRSVSNFLTGISRCQCLSLEYPHIEIPSRENGLAGVVFDRLKSLKIITGLNWNSIPVLARLFQISPTVHTISITSPGYQLLKLDKGRHEYLWKWTNAVAHMFWEPKAQSLDSFLRHFKFVEICGSSNLTYFLSLVKFLLKHGKALQQLSLLNNGDSLDLSREIESVITRFPRASSDAQIIFQGSFRLFRYMK